MTQEEKIFTLKQQLKEAQDKNESLKEIYSDLKYVKDLISNIEEKISILYYK